MLERTKCTLQFKTSKSAEIIDQKMVKYHFNVAQTEGENAISQLPFAMLMLIADVLNLSCLSCSYVVFKVKIRNLQLLINDISS